MLSTFWFTVGVNTVMFRVNGHFTAVTVVVEFAWGCRYANSTLLAQREHCSQILSPLCLHCPTHHIDAFGCDVDMVGRKLWVVIPPKNALQTTHHIAKWLKKEYYEEGHADFALECVVLNARHFVHVHTSLLNNPHCLRWCWFWL
jgi:hypothetical protein